MKRLPTSKRLRWHFFSPSPCPTQRSRSFQKYKGRRYASMCACRDRQEFHCSERQAEIVPLLSNDDFFLLPPHPPLFFTFSKQPFFCVHSRRESDLIKKHTKKKYKVALLYSHFLKAVWAAFVLSGFFKRRKVPRGEAFRARQRRTKSSALQRWAGLVWRAAGFSGFFCSGAAAQTLFLLVDQLRLVDILLSIENAISLYIEFLLVKFRINTPSRPLSNFCLCLLTNRVWQPELGEQPLSDPVTRNFYYSQLELRKRWFVFIKLPPNSSAFHSSVKQPERRAAALVKGHCGAEEKMSLND